MDTVESANVLDQLTRADWSLDALERWETQTFAPVDVRRDLARELQAKLMDETSDPFTCGLAAFILGRHHDAYRAFATLDDDDAVTCLKALSLAELGRANDALPTLTKLAKKHPNNRRIAIAAIESAARTGAVEDAEAGIAAFEQAHPGDENADYLRGFVQEHSADPFAAIETYRKVLEKKPSHARALFRLAYALDLSGDDDGAIETYEKLRDTQPTYPNAICNLGVLYEDREDYQKAIRCYQWVLNTDPYNTRAKLFLNDAEASTDMYYDEEQERLEDKFNQILRTPITDFELSVRSRNCLAKMQIETLGALVQKTEPELLSYKNFGETSLAEIKEILSSKGLHLGMSLGRDEDARMAREKAISIMFGPQKQGGPGLLGGTAKPGLGSPLDGDPETFGKPVGDIPFSMRIKRALAFLNVNTLGDLAQKAESDFLGIKNFGQTSMDELKKKIAEFGVTLKKS